MNSGLSIAFRLLLIAVSIGTCAFFLRKIRKAKVQINEVMPIAMVPSTDLTPSIHLPER